MEKDDYVICKYGGSSGEFIAARIKQVRDDYVVLENLLSGDTATRKMDDFKRRNLVVEKSVVDELIALFQKNGGSRPATRQRAVEIATALGARKPPKTAKHSSSSKKRRYKNEENAPFWNDIRDRMTAHVDGMCRALKNGNRDIVRQTFDAELNAVIAKIKTRLRNIRDSKNRKERLSFTDAVRACEVLGMSSPTPGQLPNMRQAKQLKKALVIECHPDATGDESGRERLANGLAAFKVLETYCEEQKLTRKQQILQGGGK